MPSTARTLCVSPDEIDRVLPLVTDMLTAAVEKCGDWTLREVCYALQGAQALLWIVWDGEKLSAAAVSQLIAVPKGKICQVIACGGASESWPEAIQPIEQYAKAEGCVSMRIRGRPGWSRVFPDYKTEWLSLAKRLD